MSKFSELEQKTLDCVADFEEKDQMEVYGLINRLQKKSLLEKRMHNKRHATIETIFFPVDEIDIGLIAYYQRIEKMLMGKTYNENNHFFDMDLEQAKSLKATYIEDRSAVFLLPESFQPVLDEVKTPTVQSFYLKLHVSELVSLTKGVMITDPLQKKIYNHFMRTDEYSDDLLNVAKKISRDLDKRLKGK